MADRLTAMVMASPGTIVVACCATLVLLVLSICLHTKPSKGKSRHLTRQLSGMGYTTLLTQVETNQSILFSIITLDKIVSKDQLANQFGPRMATDFFVRFRSCVVGRAFVLVDAFDVAHHLTQHAPLGPEDTVLLVAESLYNKPLDMGQPLWHVTIVHEQGDRKKTHLLWRTHHCLGDGQSMGMVLTKVFDVTHPPQALPAPVPVEGSAQRSVWHQLAYVAWSVAIYSHKIARLFLVDESTCFFKQPGSVQKHLSVSVALRVDVTKRVGKALHASINDVMLSCVAGALRQMLPDRAHHRPDLFVRAGIPISMRSPAAPFPHTSNLFSSLLVDLPLGEVDSIKRTQMVTAAMHQAKTSLEKVFTLALNRLLTVFPDAINIFVTHAFTRRVSVAITNVRGPDMRLSLGDTTVVGMLGFVPPPPGCNVGIAITSMQNALVVTVAVDKSLDAVQLRDAIESEFAALEVSVTARM
ncbi:Aste57867_8429 [Aphanomyces stellatus]|uniref:Aste57867_8429 protein n=1 Tax=Aphanomyces stellatus TaxID=120398 RepID=A0A485KK76_9STRA|nr:hypothetical protein As57867_008397 [Aphanomyces stellatus]VFT85315.1 Aste57867_8429 [Aphanomyces stellatus]